MVNVLDQVIQPGRAVRTVQNSADADLTYESIDGGGTYAVLNTNRGTLECDMGTIAIKTDGTIKWLTPTGWDDFA